MKKMIAFFITLIGLFSFGAAFAQEKPLVIHDIIASAPFDGNVARDSEGYLDTEQWPDKEFIFIDSEQGQWFYLSPTLQVQIIRYKGTYKKKPIIWYISDIKTRKEIFTSFCADPDKPGKKLLRPELIAQKHQVVYAQNGDLFTYRINKNKRPGIIIRNQMTIHKKTNTKISTGFPPLDELVLYGDGRIEVHHPGELSAEDYIKQGAVDVFSFGPILIRDGELDTRLQSKYGGREPRSAIGMVGPGHFKGFYIEARNKRSYGCELALVAQIMKSEGCVLAYNLDGGNSAAMVFMGQNVMMGADYNGYNKTRNQQDIIGIGCSGFIPEDGK